MKVVFFAIMVLCSIVVNAQTEVVKTDTAVPELLVKVEKDSRIEELTSKKIVIAKTGSGSNSNAKLKSTETVVIDKYRRVRLMGYKLQVMNSTDRALVYSTKAKLYQMYPQQRQTVIAQAPFFKLRFGNFTTKEEAERYRKALSPMFPAGVYLIRDYIEGRLQPEIKETPTTEKTKVDKTKTKTTNKTKTK